jgi:hypothetical protein
MQMASGIMSLRDRISLTWRYGKAQLLIGAVYNLVCMNFLLSGISYTFFVDCFLMKVPLTAIILYLNSKFRDRDAIFFYINLGLSLRKLQISVILADFLALAIMLTSVLVIYG